VGVVGEIPLLFRRQAPQRGANQCFISSSSQWRQLATASHPDPVRCISSVVLSCFCCSHYSFSIPEKRTDLLFPVLRLVKKLHPAGLILFSALSVSKKNSMNFPKSLPMIQLILFLLRVLI